MTHHLFNRLPTVLALYCATSGFSPIWKPHWKGSNLSHKRKLWEKWLRNSSGITSSGRTIERSVWIFKRSIKFVKCTKLILFCPKLGYFLKELHMFVLNLSVIIASLSCLHFSGVGLWLKLYPNTVHPWLELTSPLFLQLYATHWKGKIYKKIKKIDFFSISWVFIFYLK